MRTHEDKSLDIAVPDAAAVGAQDAADERGGVVVLDLPPRALGCQPCLDSIRRGELLASWPTACRGLVGAFVLTSMAVAPSGYLARRRGASSR